MSSCCASSRLKSRCVRYEETHGDACRKGRVSRETQGEFINWRDDLAFTSSSGSSLLKDRKRREREREREREKLKERGSYGG